MVAGGVATRGRKRAWLKRLLTIVIVAAVAAYVVREARQIDWASVLDAARRYSPGVLAAAFLLTLPGQLACACFDLVGRRATGHDLPMPRVMLISHTGYFFSLNLGALIGGLAFRFRLYAPYGLSPIKVGQIIALTVLTNWSGYILMAGVVMSFYPPDLPGGWGPGEGWLRAIGGTLLAIAAGYLAVCRVKGGRVVNWRGNALRIPTLPVAAVQFAISAVSWGSIGAVIASLLPDVGWFEVMPVLMLSALAGIWSHVPGGLGVTEVVFLTLLGHRSGDAELLAAVLVFRMLYYVVPFLGALCTFIYLESTATRAPPSSDSGQRTPP